MADCFNKARLDFKIRKTILAILKDENLLLKIGLLNIFQSPLNKENLETAEQLQSRLLCMDDHFLHVIANVKQYLMKINLRSPPYPGMRLLFRRRHKKLHKEINEIKDSFISLKLDASLFNQSIKPG